MEYALIVETDLEQLVQLVNTKLREGWTPLGGLLSISGLPAGATRDKHGDYWGPHATYIIQPMTRGVYQNPA